MNKLISVVIVFCVASMLSVAAQASEYVAGGFEASGHVIAGIGFQHQNNRAMTENTFDDAEQSFAGVIGRYVPQMGPNEDRLEFFIDEVELDIIKVFGEGIRLRADLDFGRFNSGTNFGAFFLEQAYATANIPLGNGVEVLLGRFNVPIGFESVDVSENDSISKSILIRSGIRPTNSTGLKFYYAFNELVDFHFYVVNRLTRDNMRAKINDLPSVGMRLGFNWGDMDQASTVGISGFWGAEHDVDSKRHFTFGGDLDADIWITERLDIGAEGIIRKDNAVAAGFQNMWTFGWLANLKYLLSENWDGFLKYAFVHQNQGSNGQWDFIGGGVKQSVHEMSLGANYDISDGATLKIEGRTDIVLPPKGSAGRTQYVYGGAIALAYDF